MIINSATLIYFSPTGTTKKITCAIAKGMGIEITKTIDLTLPYVRSTLIDSIEEDIVLIAVPVYEERIPKILYPFLTSLKGNNKPVVLITVFGNIGDGITLNELYSITKNVGFKIVGAGSFIGEHSFSTNEVPIAEERPTYQDLYEAEEFGSKILKKLQNIDELNNILKIPQGKLPLIAKILPENSARIFTKAPNVDMNICNQCGLCAKLCPMYAINKETLEIDENKCLRCFSCVKKCPKKARKITYKNKFLVSKFLTAKSKVKKKPKIYL